MTLRWLVAAIVFSFPLLRGLGAGQDQASTLFLLEEPSSHRWCSYANAGEWKSSVQRHSSRTVGELLYANRRLIQIDITDSDDTGDWITYDKYSVAVSGQPVGLSRIINVLPGDVSVSERYLIKGAKAVKIGASAKRLRSGVPLANLGDAWLPERPIFTRLASFPFSRLFEQPHPGTRGEHCVPARV